MIKERNAQRDVTINHHLQQQKLLSMQNLKVISPLSIVNLKNMGITAATQQHKLRHLLQHCFNPLTIFSTLHSPASLSFPWPGLERGTGARVVSNKSCNWTAILSFVSCLEAPCSCILKHTQPWAGSFLLHIPMLWVPGELPHQKATLGMRHHS